MLAVAEVVGLPVLVMVSASWVRADDADARLSDGVLDARVADWVESGRDRPWRETDSPVSGPSQLTGSTDP